MNDSPFPASFFFRETEAITKRNDRMNLKDLVFHLRFMTYFVARLRSWRVFRQ